MGISIEYKIQKVQMDSSILSNWGKFIGDSSCALILGDNLFYETNSQNNYGS